MVAALPSILVVHSTLASEGTCVIKPEFVPFFSVNVVYIMQLSENCSQSVKITNNCQEWGNINKSNVKHSLFVVYVKCQAFCICNFFLQHDFCFFLRSTVFHRKTLLRSHFFLGSFITSLTRRQDKCCFHSSVVTWVLVVFIEEVTKILHK